MAVYERETKTVACLECPPDPPHAAPGIASSMDALPPEAFIVVGPGPQPELFEVFTGTAGASAKREYERRKDRRETRIRDDHPYLGKLILAVSEIRRALVRGPPGHEERKSWASASTDLGSVGVAFTFSTTAASPAREPISTTSLSAPRESSSSTPRSIKVAPVCESKEAYSVPARRN